VEINQPFQGLGQGLLGQRAWGTIPKVEFSKPQLPYTTTFCFVGVYLPLNKISSFFPGVGG